jgi:acetyl esterase/lipase
VHGPDRLIISPCHLIRDVALDAPPAPTLLMHGEDDTVCLVDQSRLYASIAEERWQQVGADGAAQPLPAGFCRFVELPRTQHAFCLPNYSAAPSIVAAAMHEAVLFLGRVGHISLTAAEMAEAAGVDGGAALAAAKL